MSVVRYKLRPLRNSGYSLNPKPDGEFVRFSDYEQLLEASEEAERDLAELLEAVQGESNDNLLPLARRHS